MEVRYKSLGVESECEVVHGKPLPSLWSTTKSMLSVSGEASYSGYILDEFVPQKTSTINLLFKLEEILMEVIKREKLVGISPDPDADAYMKSIPGVLKIKANYNPTTWMLEVSSKARETQLGVDFVQIYRDSTWENKQLLKQLSSPSVQRISIFLPVCIKMVGSSSTHASGNGTDEKNQQDRFNIVGALFISALLFGVNNYS
ncbi:ABC transporter G family member 41 [Citrus clementina]|uniref:ABC transporter G family member 41 n=1 Tax=Citrus clementina TaxID=85681 RepID=UPI000CED5309|nr:ABC transporter G family member 41 [Citrus x clementina]